MTPLCETGAVGRTLLLLVALAAGLSGVFREAAAQAPADFLEEREEGEERELETDRDAFTPYSSTAGAGLTIVESSYTFIDNQMVAETHSFPELLVRSGLGPRFEVRLGWNYEVGGAGDIVSGEEGDDVFEGGGLEHEAQLLYGFKAQLTEQFGWRPRSALIVQGFTPTSGPAHDTDFSAGYACGWELANRWRLDSSLRYVTEHDARDAFNQWAPSAVLRVPVTERWNVHAEYFGIYSEGAERDFSRGFFSPGTHYLVTPNLELGVRVGWGVTQDAPDFFANVGVGWRF